jgi:site-specific recombinase XerD
MFGNDQEFSFEDVLTDVEEYYLPETDNGKKPIPHNWVTHYLSTQDNKGLNPDEVYDIWGNICDFMFFLEEESIPLEAVQGYHLSEFITEFWENKLNYVASPQEIAIEIKQDTVETIQDLYWFLAQQKYISDDVAKRVRQATATILQKEGQLTPIPK